MDFVSVTERGRFLFVKSVVHHFIELQRFLTLWAAGRQVVPANCPGLPSEPLLYTPRCSLVVLRLVDIEFFGCRIPQSVEHFSDHDIGVMFLHCDYGLLASVWFVEIGHQYFQCSMDLAIVGVLMKFINRHALEVIMYRVAAAEALEPEMEW